LHKESSDTIASATQQTRFTTFPRYLVIQIQRYELGPDWQPIKLDVNVHVPDELDLTSFKTTGPVAGEDVLQQVDEEEEVDNTQAKSHSSSLANDQNTTNTSNNQTPIDEVALSQLMDMGFSLNSCKRALVAVGGNNVEAAMGWVFEHNMDPDFNDPLPEDAAVATATTTSSTNNHTNSSTSNKGSSDVDEGMVTSLVENLGCFTSDQVRYAMKECNNAPDRAADWLFSHMDDVDDIIASSLLKQQLGEETATSSSSSHNTKVPCEDGEGKYVLFGMISHIGKNTGSGHYVAHIKKSIPNKGTKWVIFNDEKVALSSNPPTEHAYLYLFQRRDTIGLAHPGY
jgi:ubiquitin carboxyl-terminal hydrolase 5/13